ncbi:MAG: slipin family protein [Cyanobacteria bacterium]|nr:slipin family protein [Cyanobacteriota bacterium]
MEILGGLLFLTFILLLSGLRVVREYERLVVFRMGRIRRESSAGLRLVLPFLEKDVRVDTRVVTMPIPAQEALTRDNVTVRVAAVCLFQVDDCTKSVVVIADPVNAAGQAAQATLRNMIGQYDLDQLVSERDKVNARLQLIIDEMTRPWGIRVNSVELKDLDLPVGMQRAIARQAEAERVRRARVIAAEGELQAAGKLSEAASILSEPGAIGLRQLQSLTEISKEGSSTLFVPIPTDFFEELEEELNRGE